MARIVLCETERFYEERGQARCPTTVFEIRTPNFLWFEICITRELQSLVSPMQILRAAYHLDWRHI